MIIYVSILFISLISFLFLFIYLFKNKSSLSFYFSLFSLFSSVYLLGSIGILFSTNEEQALLAQKFMYFGVCFMAPLFTLFLYNLSLGKPRRKTFFSLFFIVPVLMLFFITTNELHYLFFKSVSLEHFRGFSVINATPGPLYYVLGLYHLALIGYNLFLLYRLYTAKTKSYTTLTVLFGTSVTFSLILSLLHTFRVFPSSLDVNHFSNILQLISYSLALFYYKIFDIYDLGDSIIPHLKDGVIITDSKHDLVYSNSLAKNTFSWLNKMKLGASLLSSPIGHNLTDETNSDFIHKQKDGEDITYFNFKAAKTDEIKSSKKPLTIYIFSDSTEKVLLEKELEKLIKLDGLTQIYNQISIFSKVKEKFDIAKHNKEAFSVLVIDLNNFKLFNDKFGHLYGNEILVKVANVIKNHFSCGKCVYGRFGGDEFIVSSIGINETEIQEKTIEFSKSLESLSKEIKDNTIISTSTGISYVDFNTSNSDVTFEEMVDLADRAMYEAKKKESPKYTLTKIN